MTPRFDCAVLSDAFRSSRAVPDSRTSDFSGCDRNTRRLVWAPSGLFMYAVSLVELLPVKVSVPELPPAAESANVPGAAWSVPFRNTLTLEVPGIGQSA